ncbi:MarR family winged helix-turn-helix transcriptional regulator [Nocardia arthritidis]|uniref:MarR family transcriptional regulator n=1 Tax=Nocardia arthritidis TaxID=228602 RepID=A0A6G9YNY4_9NOCA|nr:MarR family transcriptional regulator [Nocardia arthritidis]QIS14736.1 MarR family transcriptional regulator [Nocardia arthritidis]
MPESDDIMGELFPRLTLLSAVLNRGRLYDNIIRSAGLSLERPAMTILVILDGAGEPLRVGEIATQMQVEGPHVTRHINGLEQRELVARVVDPDDRRARRVALTSQGQRLVDRYTSEVRDWFAGALSGWSAADRRQLATLLERLADDLVAHRSTTEKS